MSISISQSQKLQSWIDGIENVTFFTVADQGRMVSQPISLTAYHNGEIWFFIHQPDFDHSIQEGQALTLAFIDNCGSRYVSALGRAEAVYDTEGLRETWGAYFHDKNLVLVRMSVCHADFRDTPTSEVLESLDLLTFSTEENLHAMVN